MGPNVHSLEQLLDIEAIKQLKARYFRLMDTKQWAELRAQFTDDCRFEGTSAPPSADADVFVAALSANHAQTTTVHHGHMPEIRLESPTTARGIWALMDHLSWPDDSVFRQHFPDAWGLTGAGYYQEAYRKEAGAWKIAYLRISRLRVELLKGERPPLVGGALRPLLDWLAPR